MHKTELTVRGLLRRVKALEVERENLRVAEKANAAGVNAARYESATRVEAFEKELASVHLINSGLADKLIQRDEQLASAQAENLKLREALTNAVHFAKHGGHYGRHEMVWANLLSTPYDTTALNEYVTHAVAKRLEELGSYVTNDASRNESIAQAFEAAALKLVSTEGLDSVTKLAFGGWLQGEANLLRGKS